MTIGHRYSRKDRHRNLSRLLDQRMCVVLRTVNGGPLPPLPWAFGRITFTPRETSEPPLREHAGER